ncbi:A24 family peptidase [Vibrio tubiashii]|uniref:A24 family peptidase n=1 Tax=Vibrio tubiashii TaxID=29498 RepID=UPI00234EC1E6|nr:A24 family peptidase [Vibrio tubiashii]WCP67683.1 A24 family peptidase [Vibrio tubiashii]
MEIFIGYLIWIGFVVTAVSDAREHRIPNLYLLIILGLCVIEKGLSPQPLNNLLWALVAGLCFFGASLLLHILRVMAPGDVKLLGVVGFWLGWGNLRDATFWIAVSSVAIGLLYALVNRAENEGSLKVLLTKYSMLAAYGSKSFEPKPAKERIEQKLRMPFAPVMVIGLAMHQYY